MALQVHPLEGVPRLRREPYRLLFPLGLACGGGGVGQWLLLSMGLGAYRPIFHAMVQVEGFIGCFVAGFLFTFVPRRTGGAPPSWATLGAVALSTVGLAVFAWLEKWALSSGFYLVQLSVLLFFVARRLYRSVSERKPDDHLLWVPLSLAMGLIADVMTGVAAIVHAMGLHDIGRHLVLEGVVSGLVIGVGSFLVPVITRRESPRGTPSLAGKLQQGALFLVFVASFFIEGWVSLRAGLLLRGTVALLALIGGGRLWRRPTVQGLNAHLVWVAAWCLPLGYLLAGAFPLYRAALVHVVYVGSFATLAMSVGMHVALSHANRPQKLLGAPAALVGLSLCAASTLVFRLLYALAPEHALQWMTAATVAFLTGAALWLFHARQGLFEGPYQHPDALEAHATAAGAREATR